MKTYRVRYGTQQNYTTVYVKAESVKAATDQIEKEYGARNVFGDPNIVEIREW